MILRAAPEFASLLVKVTLPAKYRLLFFNSKTDPLLSLNTEFRIITTSPMFVKENKLADSNSAGSPEADGHHYGMLECDMKNT